MQDSLPANVDFSSLSKFKRSINQVDFSTYVKGTNDDDDEIAYFTVRWKTRASFVYHTKNMR